MPRKELRTPTGLRWVKAEVDAEEEEDEGEFEVVSDEEKDSREERDR